MTLRGYLPVHCCCDPGRRLGWAPVTHPDRDRARYVIIQPAKALWPPDVNDTPAQVLDVEIATVVVPARKREAYVCPKGSAHYTVPVMVRRRALKNEDHPLDLWRRVPGFIEDPKADPLARAARSSRATRPRVARS